MCMLADFAHRNVLLPGCNAAVAVCMKRNTVDIGPENTAVLTIVPCGVGHSTNVDREDYGG